MVSGGINFMLSYVRVDQLVQMFEVGRGGHMHMRPGDLRYAYFSFNERKVPKTM
jgi:hypothetical protein